MTKDWLRDAGFETVAIREGLSTGSEQEHSDPIYATSSFVFDSAEQAAATFSGEREGNTYSRFSNPTVSVFEKRLAAMESGEEGVATSSGMSAILTLCLTVLRSGDHVVCSKNVFGSTVSLFNNILTKLDIQVSFVALRDLREWREAVRPNTKLFFCETPSNPLCEVGDIRQIAAIAHSADAVLAVDNCFCTPALQRPLDLGADVVMHSATKYLDGQGRVLGGALVGSADLMTQVRAFVRVCGPSMSPFNAWVHLKSMETLEIRVRHHCQSAQKVAEFLERQKIITKVLFPGLKSHPQYELAQKQMNGPGTVICFELKGDMARTFRFMNAMKLIDISNNLGDAKSLTTHPATTTHQRISDKERSQLGITDGFIRLSIGLEDVEDLKEDIAQALSKV